MNKKLGQNWLDKIDDLIAQNSKLSIFLFMQIITTALLVIGYIKLSNKLEVYVELPKTVKEEGIVVVGKEYANETFFRIWAREDIEVISVYNHKSIKNKMEYLKQRMYPPSYYKYEELLISHEKEISSNLISQKFTFGAENILVSMDKETSKSANIVIKGFYSKYIDDEEVIKAQECLYDVDYTIEGGRIYVKSFKTTCE